MNQGIPRVFFDRVCPDILTDRVIINDEEGGFLATEYLIQIGCKKIALFSAPQNLLIGQGRLAGYTRALRQYKMDIDPKMIIHCDTSELAWSLTADFITRHPEVDGIFAVNDSTAISTIQVLQKMNKKVPDDISVVGFGDGPNALICSPTLTTIEQKGYEIGMEAVKLLVYKIENETSPDSFQTKVITPNLIVRESTRRKFIHSANG